MAPYEVGIDFNALLRAWAKASERSVGRKKRILMAVLQHSLRADPEEYERGLGLQILEALEGLNYGDILVLRKVVTASEARASHQRENPYAEDRSRRDKLRCGASNEDARRFDRAHGWTEGRTYPTSATEL